MNPRLPTRSAHARSSTGWNRTAVSSVATRSVRVGYIARAKLMIFSGQTAFFVLASLLLL